MVNCAVRGCRSNVVKKGVRFFRLPTDGRRNELWRAFTKRDDFFPKYPRICELHFDASQFELKRQDGWRKLKWTAVPTLRPPPSSDQQLSKEHEQESFTERQIDSSLKLTDGEELHNAASVTSADTVAEKHLDEQQESEEKASSRKLCTFGVNRDTGTRVVRDKRVLRNLLGTIAENIRNVSFQLQETTNRKSQLMQTVNSLTQEEIMLQRRLKKESDKENVLKQQLQEIEDEEKDLLKEEKPCCEELDTLMQQNHHHHMRTEDWKVEQQCCKELSAFIEKDSHNGLQIAAQKENDLIAKNIFCETSAAKQMELKLFDGLVAFSIVDSVQFVSLKLVNDEDTNKSGDCNPGLLKDSTIVTDSSDTAQADDVTMFAESLAEKTDRVECDSFDQSNTVCSVETSAPPMLLQRNHVCSFCGKRFWNAGARQSHEYSHWTEFRCDICDKVFPYRDRLVNHKKTHSDEKPFGCTLCDQRFRTNGTLNRHFRYHTGEKHYVCSVCSETFFYAHQRKVHMSVHTGKQPFMCQDCGRSFSCSSSLAGHVRIHRGEKPYECDVCGKRFRQSSQVKAHKEVHGEKPYICSRCGKRLGVASFWPHMKQHSGVKIYYQCAVCDKKLSTKKTLEMHTRMVHMGEAPYVCEICYKEFGKRKEFQLHKKEHEHCSS